ncbi:MAG: ABC transporter ATP-binding protein [Candidatus Magasanikbacteria bacterium]|nr:ABC transporter ATP-binding protein [Candidatus Magasanikbacteria bacterium]
MENNTNYSYKQLLVDALKLIRPYKGRFWIGSLLRLSTDILFLYTTFALSETLAFFATYKQGDSIEKFWFYLNIWFISQALVFIFRQIGKFFMYQVAERINLDSQLQALNHLSLLDIAWHEHENTGNKLKRIHKGGDGWNTLTRIWADNFLQIVVSIIGITIILAKTDWQVGAVLLVFFVTYLLISLPLQRRASLAARAVNKLEEDFTGLSFETMNNIRTVKLMNIFPRIFPRLSTQANKVFLATKNRAKWFRTKSAVQGVWAAFFRLVTSGVIAYGITQGQYTLSFLLLFNLYFGTLRDAVEELSEISQDIIIARYDISRLDSILSTPVSIDLETNKVDFPKNWQTITLQNVSFAYGNRKVLKNINFTINRGDRIGVVGLSGAGKSTLFKLLLKEYENYTGEILVDGVPLKTIKKINYFEHVAVVPQETEVFNFSLRDNIILASNEGKNENARLKRALSIAHITDFMSKLSDGVETFIGEKGVRLSGGEKQRVGIARAVYKNPSIIFMDEATSHLDSESEEKIKDAMHQVFQEVTALVIAHRLSTIQEMDTILLFENGELAEAGNFKELQKKRGRFAQLWEKQKL